MLLFCRSASFFPAILLVWQALERKAFQTRHMISPEDGQILIRQTSIFWCAQRLHTIEFLRKFPEIWENAGEAKHLFIAAAQKFPLRYISPYAGRKLINAGLQFL